MDFLADKVLDVAICVFKQVAERQKFEKAVIDSAKDMYQYKGQNEDSEKIKYTLTDGKMKALAERLNALSPIQWERQVMATIYYNCITNEVLSQDAEKYSIEYWNVLKNKIIKLFPGRFDSILMNELSNQIEEFRSQNHTDLQMLGSTINSRMDAIEARLSLMPVAKETVEIGQLSDSSYIAVNDCADEWNISTQHSMDSMKDAEEKRQELTRLSTCWKKEREQYPGWYIIPYEHYEKLKYNTFLMDWLNKCEELDVELLLDFYYEYCWRWNKSMFLIKHYELHRIMNFWFLCYDTMVLQGDKLDKWIFIGLCLLRDCREGLDFDKWQEIYSCMEKYNIQETMHRDAVWIEKVRMHLHQMQLKNVIDIINSVDEKELSLPVQLQLAGILAECGEIENAILRLKKLEQLILNELAGRSTVPVERTQLLSLLSCTYQLHKCVYGSTQIFSSSYKDDPIVKELNGKIKEYETFYSLDANMKAVEKDLLHWAYEKDRRDNTTFDIHRETVTIVSGSEMYCEGAYYMYRSLELMAMPMEIRNVSWLPKELVYYMDTSLLESCWKLGLFMLLRGDNEKLIKTYVDHLWVYEVPRETIYSMIDFLLQALRYNMYEFKNHTEWRNQNLYTNLLTNSVELLQRLASYCAPYQYAELMQVMIELLKENCVSGYGKMDQFVEYIMRYIPEEKKAEYLNQMIQLPIVKRSIHGSEHQVEVLEAANHHENTTFYFEEATISHKAVESLLSKRCGDEFQKKVVLERLMMLYEWGHLDEKQQKQFTEMLWSEVSEKTGLPKLENRYSFAFLKLPHPEGIDIVKLLKKNILNNDWMTDIDQKGISMTGGDIVCLKEILGLGHYHQQRGLSCWTKEEATTLIDGLVSYVRDNSTRLTEERNIPWSISDEFKERFVMIQKSIVSVMRTTEDSLYEMKNKIYSVFEETYESMEDWILVRTVVADEDEISICVKTILNQLYCGRSISSALDASEYLLSCHILPEKEEHDFFLQLLWLTKACREKGLASLLIIIHNCFYSEVLEFTSEEMEEVGKILDNIRALCQYSECKNEKEMKQYILIRTHCAKLAFEVHNYCKKYQIPELDAVKAWQKICHGEEFAEVKNGWLYG